MALPIDIETLMAEEKFNQKLTKRAGKDPFAVFAELLAQVRSK